MLSGDASLSPTFAAFVARPEPESESVIFQRVYGLLDQEKLTSSESLAPEASEASGKVVDIALNW